MCSVNAGTISTLVGWCLVEWCLREEAFVAEHRPMPAAVATTAVCRCLVWDCIVCLC